MQPEWFYKGDGSVVVKPGGSFLSPKFALDGSEEPECVGLYVISDEGVPFRVGYVRHPTSRSPRSMCVFSVLRGLIACCRLAVCVPAGARQ